MSATPEANQTPNGLEAFFAPLGVKPLEVLKFNDDYYIRAITKFGDKILIYVDEDLSVILGYSHILINLAEADVENYTIPFDCEGCLCDCTNDICGFVVNDGSELWCKVSRSQGEYDTSYFVKTGDTQVLTFFEGDAVPYTVIRFSYLIRNPDKMVHMLIRKSTQKILNRHLKKMVKDLHMACDLARKISELFCKYHKTVEETLVLYQNSLLELEVKDLAFEGTTPSIPNLKARADLWENILYRRISLGNIVDGSHKMIEMIDPFNHILGVLRSEQGRLCKIGQSLGGTVKFKYISQEELIAEASMSMRDIVSHNDKGTSVYPGAVGLVLGGSSNNSPSPTSSANSPSPASPVGPPSPKGPILTPTSTQIPKGPILTPTSTQIPGSPIQPQIPSSPIQPQIPGSPIQPQIPGSPIQPQIPGSPTSPFQPIQVPKIPTAQGNNQVRPSSKAPGSPGSIVSLQPPVMGTVNTPPGGIVPTPKPVSPIVKAGSP